MAERNPWEEGEEKKGKKNIPPKNAAIANKITRENAMENSVQNQRWRKGRYFSSRRVDDDGDDMV